MRAGRLRRLPPDLCSAILIGPCMEYVRQYVSGHARTPIDQAIQELGLAAWRSLSVEQQAE